MTAVYTDLLTDTMYFVRGVDIVPEMRGPALTGEWRSRIVVNPDHPGFGWLRVNGDLGATAVVRVYADGALFYTSPALATRTPTRMPPGRFRKWEVEVESTARITDVILATSAAELERA